MLTIRKEQMAVFEAAGQEKFETSMVEHVQQYFPNHFRIAGEPVIRQVVRYGIGRARQYDFASERDISLYLTVMFMLGSNFDTDFMYPWAGQILQGENDPSQRADQLADTALDVVQEIAGPENRSINRAIVTFHKELPGFRKIGMADDYSQYLKATLKSIHPKKYEILGDRIIAMLINDGITKASSYKIGTESGFTLLIAMMFFMGSLIDREPFLPWLSAILNDESTTGRSSMEDRLFGEVTVFLEKWLEKP